MSTRAHSSEQEKRVAKMLGGYVQPNSGATPFRKGDVATKNILIECKTVMKEQKSVTVQKKWFSDLQKERLSQRKDHGVVAFDFGDGEDYFILDKRTFMYILETLEEVF